MRAAAKVSMFLKKKFLLKYAYLLCCVSFCCKAKGFSYTYIYIYICIFFHTFFSIVVYLEKIVYMFAVSFDLPEL